VKKILGLVCGLLLFSHIAFGADNFEVTAGSGTTLAFDDAAGVMYQKVKLIDSTADSTTATGVAASPLQVSLANHGANATPVLVDLGAADTLGTVTTVGTISSVTTLPAITGTVTANAGTNLNTSSLATETTLGTVHGHVDSIDTKTPALGQALAAASVPVILPSATITTLTPPAAITGFATSAKQLADGHNVAVASIAAGDNNIGNVDIVSGTVTTVSTLTDQTKMNGQTISMGTGTRDAGTQRVTIATNDAVPVTFTGSTDAATQTTLAAINTKLATGTVIGDVNLGATDNAVLDSIVTNTNRAAITGYGQAKLDHADVTTAQVLVAAVADKKFYITSIILSVAAAGSYWIEDDDAAQITSKFTLAANGGVSWSCPIDTPFKSTTVNKGLKLKGSAAGAAGIMITYYTLA